MNTKQKIKLFTRALDELQVTPLFEMNDIIKALEAHPFIQNLKALSANVGLTNKKKKKGGGRNG